MTAHHGEPEPTGPVEPTPSPGRNNLPLIVASVVVLLLVLVGGLVFALSKGEPTSVREVADRAVKAAEDLDVGDGIELLCNAPSGEDRRELNELIGKARDRAGTHDPDVDYEISDIEGDTSGSFVVTVTSTEEGLEDRQLRIKVLVEEKGGRSCIAGTAKAD